MGEFKGKGLVLRGMLITPHQGSRVQRLAVRELRSRAGNLFTFVEKHKAHPGAVWEGSRERVRLSWNARQASQGLPSSAPSGSRVVQ